MNNLRSDGDDYFLNLRLQNEVDNIADKNEIREMLKMQQAEMEMLSSVFPNPGELVIYDQSIIADINAFVEEKMITIPPYLDYTINLTIDDLKVELCVNLPSDYPEAEPEIFVRSNQLARNQQTQLNADIANYISSLERGEVCIYSAVMWVQENAPKYNVKTQTREKKHSEKGDRQSFTRHWIYSHHIYSKIKRKEMLELAHSYNISGFCLPGKPGIICIEGQSPNCNQWWQTIRGMTWKKIICKKTEEEKVKSHESIDIHRKFGKFQEITFVNENPNQRDHMDMGEFFRYLKDHDCGYIFKDYFGIDGKLGKLDKCDGGLHSVE